MSNLIHGLKLLIAEEDEAMRRFLADNFAADGASVEIATAKPTACASSSAAPTTSSRNPSRTTSCAHEPAL